MLVDSNIGPRARCYPSCNRNPFVKLRDCWTLFLELDSESIYFQTTAQQKDWKLAIKKEIDSILKNQT